MPAAFSGTGNYSIKEIDITIDNGQTWSKYSYAGITPCDTATKIIFKSGSRQQNFYCSFSSSEGGPFVYNETTKELIFNSPAGLAQIDGIIENYKSSGFTIDENAVSGNPHHDRLILVSN